MSIMATIRWCPIFPKWDIYQPLISRLDLSWATSLPDSSRATWRRRGGLNHTGIADGPGYYKPWIGDTVWRPNWSWRIRSSDLKKTTKGKLPSAKYTSSNIFESWLRRFLVLGMTSRSRWVLTLSVTGLHETHLHPSSTACNHLQSAFKIRCMLKWQGFALKNLWYLHLQNSILQKRSQQIKHDKISSMKFNQYPFIWFGHIWRFPEIWGYPKSSILIHIGFSIINNL